MKVRAIKELCQLPNEAFFAEVSEGFDLTLNHAEQLFVSAQSVAESDEPAGEILAAVSEEEAAKCQILLDAVRCPRKPQKRFSEQLARFNDHLSKGLYAKAYEMAPGTLGDLQGYLDTSRTEYYLDGPNDIDWIFPNEALHGRESRFYVDYVKTDEGREWLDPRRYQGAGLFGLLEPTVLEVSKELKRVGITTPAALKAVATIWRSFRLTRETSWNENLEVIEQIFAELRESGLLKEEPTAPAYQWQFPLYDLDLSLIEVDQDQLRSCQANSSPE